MYHIKTTMNGEGEIIKKCYKGSLTVEAAIVVPIFLFAMVTILYLLKITYIHEQLQMGIEQVAEDMAANGYLFKRTGLLEFQQELYTSATGERDEFIQSLTNLDETKEIINNLDSFIGAVGVAEGIGGVNHVIGSNFLATDLQNYIEEADCVRWGIVDGFQGLSFSQSSFMLEDDDIQIVISYKIKFPLLNRYISELPMKQSVSIRAFTGNGNYNTSYLQVDEQIKDDEETEIVYVTENGVVYHRDPKCHYIFTDIKTVQYSQVKNDKTICKVCASKNIELEPTTSVYTTTKSLIFHSDKDCYTINKSVNPITLEEAIELGLRLCSSKTCQSK